MAKADGAPIDEEIIRKLMELRSYLEKKISELESEVEKLKSIFQIIDEVIVTKSFQRAEVLQAQPSKAMHVAEAPSTISRGEERPLKAATGVLLANLYVSEDELRIVPAEGMRFTTSISPFQAFLVRKVFEPLQSRDKEEVRVGTLAPDRVFSYDVVTDGDVIKEIVIRNYGDQRRLRELTASVRWTLEKMYEKTRIQS